MPQQKTKSAVDTQVELIKAEALPWQRGIISQLVEQRKQAKLPHAILLEMKTSVDSRSFGWQLAKSILCQHPGADNQPCNECHHCQLMRSNSYPDFTFTTLVENERSHKLNRDIKIEQIRKLIHQLTLTPNLSAGKLALIYPAERMNASAANSLLKTLEEPSNDSTLILLTHNSGRLPITIRSRCQYWALNNPPREQAVTWLQANGMEDGKIDEYLQLTRSDAQLALHLEQQDTLRHQVNFQQALKSYLADQSSVFSLSKELKQQPEATLQLVLRNTLLALIHKQLDRELDSATKSRLIELLELINHTSFVLQTEENNLILQLQLEDVLISLKEIMNRGRSHASTR